MPINDIATPTSSLHRGGRDGSADIERATPHLPTDLSSNDISAMSDEKELTTITQSDTDTVPALPSPNEVGPPPDGGLRAWLTVAGAFIAAFAQFGLTNSYGVFQDHYESHTLKDHSSDSISWIGGVQTFLLFFGGLMAGRAFDAYGARAVLVPGSIAFVLSLMLTSLCKEYYQFMLAQGILFGIGSALIFTPVMSVPSQWFARRRGLATSIAVTGSGLGGTLWPIAIRRMIEQIGFPWAIRACGFIALFCFICANLLITTRLPPKKAAPVRTLLRPFKEKTYALFACGMAIAAWGWFTPFFFLSTNATRLGASASIAAYSISFLNAGSTVGRLFAAFGDRLGRYNLITVSTFVMGLILLVFWIPLRTVDALIAFGVLYGFLVGVVISLIPPCVAQVSPIHEIGQRVGTLYAFISLLILTGPPINGAFLHHYPGQAGYTYSGVFSGVVVVVGSGFILASRLCVSRKLWVAV